MIANHLQPPPKIIVERSESGEFRACVATHSFDTMFYVLRKQAGGKEAKEGIKDIREAFGVTPVTESVIDNAIEANWRNFEDAIHYEAAKAAGCDAIVTRKAKDFKKSELSILSPQEFLDQLKSSKEE